MDNAQQPTTQDATQLIVARSFSDAEQAALRCRNVRSHYLTSDGDPLTGKMPDPGTVGGVLYVNGWEDGEQADAVREQVDALLAMRTGDDTLPVTTITV